MLEHSGIIVKISKLGKVKFTLHNSKAGITVKLCIKVNGQWYATAANYTYVGTTFLTSWGNRGEVKSINITRRKIQWLISDYTLGTVLQVGAQPASDLHNGEVTGIGILANPLVDSSVLQFTYLKLYT